MKYRNLISDGNSFYLIEGFDRSKVGNHLSDFFISTWDSQSKLVCERIKNVMILKNQLSQVQVLSYLKSISVPKW